MELAIMAVKITPVRVGETREKTRVGARVETRVGGVR
jgi:hypothetical protein